MSRPDTDLFFKFPQIDRQQQDLQIAQKQALIAEQKARTEDQLAQAEERRRQADNLVLKNQETRRTYNAQQSVQTLLQTKPDETIEEQISTGGMYAMPFIKERLAQTQEGINQAKARLDQHSRKMQEIGDAALNLKSLPPDQRPQAHQAHVQRMLQDGIISQQEANAMLQSHDTDEELDQIIATTPAAQTQIKRQQDDLEAKSKRNLQDQQAAEAAARTK